MEVDSLSGPGKGGNMNDRIVKTVVSKCKERKKKRTSDRDGMYNMTKDK